MKSVIYSSKNIVIDISIFHEKLRGYFPLVSTEDTIVVYTYQTTAFVTFPFGKKFSSFETLMLALLMLDTYNECSP